MQQIDGTLSTIEMQREALEGANTNTAILDVMKDAALALKTVHKDLYKQTVLLFVIWITVLIILGMLMMFKI